jgi:hypothetical protein
MGNPPALRDSEVSLPRTPSAARAPSLSPAVVVETLLRPSGCHFAFFLPFSRHNSRQLTVRSRKWADP